jgi:iron complex outermembrane recepter protein
LRDGFRLAQVDRAQTDGTVAQPDIDTGSGNAPSAVQEVLVTARKRQERIQDVPMSIAIVTSDDIDKRGAVSASDYLRGIPGVSQVDSAEGQSIIIRGMETSPYFQNFSSGPTTATYFGETPTTNAGGLGTSTNIDLKLVDVQRVEVLRGPQGTAFGNSSLGGAVRTIPVAPKVDTWEAKGSVSYSMTSGSGDDNYNVQLIGNMPLVSDRLTIRATGYQFEDSGFYRNRAGSDAAFRAAVAPYGGLGFAVDSDEVGSSLARGGRASVLFRATDDIQLTLSYLTQKTETDGMTVANRGAFDQTMLQVAPAHVVRGGAEGVSDTDIDIANAVIEYETGWGNLLATYSHTKSSSIVTAPYQLSGRYWPVSYISDSGHVEDVGEIRLVTQREGAWNFLVGVYAENLKDDYFTDYQWFGDPATNIACPACVGRAEIGNQVQHWNLKQQAAFGEVSWNFAPAFVLTGGVRTYDYERSIAISSPDGFFFSPVAAGTTTTRTDASGSNFRANLSYKPGDGSLFYAEWAQGFRLGKPQAVLPAGTCDMNGDGIIDNTNVNLQSTGTVDSDDVDNYEIGGKFALLGRRVLLDAAIFRMEWNGLPVRVGTPAPCNRAYNTNAGAALSEGVEVQASVQVADPFRIDLGGSWIHARLTEDVPAQGFHAGDRLPGSAAVNVNLGLQYELVLSTYKILMRADSIYVGPFYGDVLKSPNTKAGDYVKLDASVRMELGSLNVDLFARNLTNESAYTFRGILPSSAARPLLGDNYGYRLRPRTFGVQVGYTF